jgi:TRAP-type mannitol/chloroaromatic compound transport system substrate-binding protein
MKFYEAAQYYYTGGMHEPGAQLSLTSNKSWWSGLSDTQRAIITAAALEENANSYYEATALNGEYLQRLQDEQGVEVRSFNEDVWDAMGEAAMEVFEETAAHSDLAARVNESAQETMRNYGRGIALFEGQFVDNRNRIMGIG